MVHALSMHYLLSTARSNRVAHSLCCAAVPYTRQNQCDHIRAASGNHCRGSIAGGFRRISVGDGGRVCRLCSHASVKSDHYTRSRPNPLATPKRAKKHAPPEQAQMAATARCIASSAHLDEVRTGPWRAEGDGRDPGRTLLRAKPPSARAHHLGERLSAHRRREAVGARSRGRLPTALLVVFAHVHLGLLDSVARAEPKVWSRRLDRAHLGTDGVPV
mmetsp:Transcript_9440/g.22693  ORF Transcript_9440/g.22693 Transcript_9440/m.22693 type:complete len:217 (+) Transcript_9440:121-771(+)